MAKGAAARRRTGAAAGDTPVGFAKLQGEDFEFYMQTYSIVLGRGSKTSVVDVDLASIGGGMNISRRHARIFYDFPRRRFSLEVLGKNGCLVEGVLHEPGSPPVKLDSRNLIQMGEKIFYFLLPCRSVFDPADAVARHPGATLLPGRATPRDCGNGVVDGDEEEREGQEGEADQQNEEDEARSTATASSGKRQRDLSTEEEIAPLENLAKKPERRSRALRETDDQLLLQLEEKDVICSVATLYTNLCGPGERLPMEKLHQKLFEVYGNVWHHSRVRRYLTSEDRLESATTPWFGLLVLLKKYPEHFLIHSQSKGTLITEFVELISSPC